MNLDFPLCPPADTMMRPLQIECDHLDCELGPGSKDGLVRTSDAVQITIYP